MNAMLSWTGTRLGQKGLCRWLLPLLTAPRLPVHAFQSTVHVHRLPLLPLHSVLYSSTVCRQHPCGRPRCLPRLPLHSVLYSLTLCRRLRLPLRPLYSAEPRFPCLYASLVHWISVLC